MATQTIAAPAHVSPERVVDFDYLAPPGHEEDVHRAWHRLHDMGVPPIVWTPHYGGHWIATRADDIDAIQIDHARFSHASVTVPKAVQTFRLVPLEMDPPEHTPFRALLSAKFGPRPVANLESSVRALANELIDGFIDDGECEFVDAFAKRLPIVVFLRLVDLPLEDREILLEMTEASVRGDAERRAWASGELQQYVGEWIAERRARPGPDLFSAMVNAKVSGRDYTPEETFGLLVNVIFGGLDTVAASIGFLTRHLAENAESRRAAGARPVADPGRDRRVPAPLRRAQHGARHHPRLRIRGRALQGGRADHAAKGAARTRSTALSQSAEGRLHPAAVTPCRFRRRAAPLPGRGAGAHGVAGVPGRVAAPHSGFWRQAGRAASHQLGPGQRDDVPAAGLAGGLRRLQSSEGRRSCEKLDAGLPVHRASSRISSAARHAMAIIGPLVLPDSMVGATERSITRKPCTPLTRSRASTTLCSSPPMRQVPQAW